MNVNAIWFPVALLASTLTSTVDTDAISVLPAAVAVVPDLCAELDRFGHPARCEAYPPEELPRWDAEVCCNSRVCTELGSAGCKSGFDRYWCESALLESDGTVVCVYQVPSFCEVFSCGPADLTAPPLDNGLCCYEVGCYDPEGGLCGGTEVWCYNGVSNEDGTVTCLDGE